MILIVISIFLACLGVRGLQISYKIGNTYGYDVVIEFFGDEPITVRMVSLTSLLIVCIACYLFYLGCTL